jgi:hypothetical protein
MWEPYEVFLEFTDTPEHVRANVFRDSGEIKARFDEADAFSDSMFDVR